MRGGGGGATGRDHHLFWGFVGPVRVSSFDHFPKWFPVSLVLRETVFVSTKLAVKFLKCDWLRRAVQITAHIN